MNKTQTDMVFNGQASGSVAQKLMASGMRVNALRPYLGKDNQPMITGNDGSPQLVTNATLRKDEWKDFDMAVIRAARERLVGVQALLNRGLVYNLSNGLGKTVLEYEDLNDFTDASMSMDGVTRGNADRPNFELKYLPLPIIHKEFYLNARVLEASRTHGNPLDTTGAEMAARTVAEKSESILYNGASSFAFGGGTIYGLTDHPDRNTYSLTAAWNASGADGESILDDVLAMKQAAIDAGFYGPFSLDVPTNFETALDEDFKANSDLTVRERLLQIGGIDDVKVVDKLTDSNVVLTQMTSDVIRLVNGMPISTVEWSSEGGMTFTYKVMAIQVPQIRSDQDGNCGVVHGS